MEKSLDDKISNLIKVRRFDEAISELKPYVEGNDHEAIYQMARILFDESDSHQDCPQGLALYKQASDLGNPMACLSLGFIYESGRNVDASPEMAEAFFKKSAAIWSEMAKDGDPDSEAMVGFLTLLGKGVEQNTEVAIAALVRAVKNGSEDSIEILGDLLLKGNSEAEKHSDIIIEKLTVLSNASNAKATLCLGKLSLYGCVATQNTTKAVELLSIASENGDDESNYILGRIYSDGKFADIDHQKAFLHFKQAADNKYTPAMVCFAIHFLLGNGVDKSVSDAECIFVEAAELGSTDAMLWLSKIYLDGVEVERDFKKSLNWLSDAAKKNCAEAQGRLGEMYDNGFGVDVDQNEAIKWYALGAENGDRSSQNHLGVYLLEGKVVKTDHEAAMKWFRLAAQQGLPDAMGNVGHMFLRGIGVPQDFREALAWFKRGAERGDAFSMRWLAWMFTTGTGVGENISEGEMWNARAENREKNIILKGPHVEAAPNMQVASDKAKKEARRQAFKQFTRLIAVTCLVPLIGIASAFYLDHDLWGFVKNTVAHREAPKPSDAIIVAMKLSSVSDLCATADVARDWPTTCMKHTEFAVLKGSSAIILISGGILIPAIYLSAMFCGTNRQRLARVFPKLAIVVGGYGVVTTLVQALVIGYVGLAVPTVALGFNLGPLVWVMVIWGIWGSWSIFKAIKGYWKWDLIARTGTTVTRLSQPALFETIDAIAAQMGCKSPDNVIVGAAPEFFMTSVPVKVIGESEPKTGTTLYMSLPITTALSVEQFSSVLAHEIAHYKNEDLVYCEKFAPVYYFLWRTLRNLIDGKSGIWGASIHPVRNILLFLFTQFTEKEKMVSRERELKADEAAAEVYTPRDFAVALIKISVLSPLWRPTVDKFIDSIGKGLAVASLTNAFRTTAQEALASMEGNVLYRVLPYQIPHPTDSHPTVERRLINVGQAVESFLSLDYLHAERPASDMIKAYGEIDGYLTRLERDVLVSYGHAKEPYGR